MITVLMVEIEPAEGISSRKLVLETAKQNVITAYSVEDGVRLLRRFPNVDALVVHAQLARPYTEIIDEARKIRPDVPVILLSPTASEHCPGCTAVVSSHEPQQLLDVLGRMMEKG